jgi:radical SAM superfamily enzyme YgiQ (UPF0313 family)
MITTIPVDQVGVGLPEVGLNVWLADLTYTQQSISSEIMPQAIGGIATYAATRMKLAHPIRIFKYPEALAEALREGPPPDVLGFSNYIWNTRLSLAMAARVKQRLPHVTTVFGGPHYPVIPAEQEAFLRDRLGANVDFYVDREGEQSFANLLLALHEADGAVEPVHGKIAGVHSVDTHNQAHLPPPEPRLRSLTGIPSPYTAGLMDGFFDGRLIPVVQTNRGCPFSCSFCVEGTRYYTKVAKKTADRMRAELHYIGEKMRDLAKEEGVRNELLITDSNFGMYQEDLDTCDIIAECQDTYGWPRYINLTTGKNKRDRVLDAISRTRGTMDLSGSVQSLDPQVLKTIRRSNIDANALMEVALAAAEKHTGTYSEVILGLPGDSKRAHFSTLSQLLDAQFDRLNMFQLALLPGSDLWTGDQRHEHGMRTRFRAIPRCYGQYEVLGGMVTAAEIDEICVELPSMPFDDYLDCRQANLFVSACYNEGTLAGLVALLRTHGVLVFSWLERMQQLPFGPDIRRVVDEFRAETQAQLWHSRDDLAAFTNENIQRFISGELGNNLLYTYRARVLTEAFDDVVDLAKQAAHELCPTAAGDDGELIDSFIEEVGEHHRLRMVNLVAPRAEAPRYQVATFDIDRFLAAPGPVAQFRLPGPYVREYTLSAEQVGLIEGYLKQFGSAAFGAGRMLTRIRINDLLRHVELVPADDARFGDSHEAVGMPASTR